MLHDRDYYEQKLKEISAEITSLETELSEYKKSFISSGTSSWSYHGNVSLSNRINNAKQKQLLYRDFINKLNTLSKPSFKY